MVRVDASGDSQPKEISTDEVFFTNRDELAVEIESRGDTPTTVLLRGPGEDAQRQKDLSGVSGETASFPISLPEDGGHYTILVGVYPTGTETVGESATEREYSGRR